MKMKSVLSLNCTDFLNSKIYIFPSRFLDHKFDGDILEGYNELQMTCKSWFLILCILQIKYLCRGLSEPNWQFYILGCQYIAVLNIFHQKNFCAKIHFKSILKHYLSPNFNFHVLGCRIVDQVSANLKNGEAFFWS